ncbi:MAG: thioredoxin family protein [Bacilli bacterium]
MKKIIFILAIFSLTFFTGCGTKSYTEISYDELQVLIEDSESFILYVGSASCTSCAKFKPTIEQVITDYDLDVKYIDISKLDEKEYAVLHNYTKADYTPTVEFVVDGVVQTSPKVVGNQTYSAVVKAFTKSGYIEGE